jgi:U3 small nucleolar RNA-associated protein MPP10
MIELAGHLDVRTTCFGISVFSRFMQPVYDANGGGIMNGPNVALEQSLCLTYGIKEAFHCSPANLRGKPSLPTMVSTRSGLRSSALSAPPAPAGAVDGDIAPAPITTSSHRLRRVAPSSPVHMADVDEEIEGEGDVAEQVEGSKAAEAAKNVNSSNAAKAADAVEAALDEGDENVAEFDMEAVIKDDKYTKVEADLAADAVPAKVIRLARKRTRTIEVFDSDESDVEVPSTTTGADAADDPGIVERLLHATEERVGMEGNATDEEAKEETAEAGDGLEEDTAGADAEADIEPASDGTDPDANTDADASGSDFESFVDKVLSNPSLVLARSRPMSDMCRRLVRELYNRQTAAETGSAGPGAERPRKRRKARAPLGPLLAIEVGREFEVDQIWEELALRNRPLGAHLSRGVRHAVRVHENAAKQKALSGERVAQAQRDVSAPTNFMKQGEDEGEVDGEERGIAEGSEVNADAELDGNCTEEEGEDGTGDDEKDDDEDDEMINSRKAPVSSKKRVRFNIGSSYSSGGEGNKDDNDAAPDRGATTPTKLEDGFFSIADMEAFADEAEELAIDGKLMGSDDEEEQRIRANNIEDDSDDDDGLAIGRTKHGAVRMSKTDERIRYTDFFDAPETGDEGAAARALRRATTFDEDEGDSGNDEKHVTPLDRERATLRADISALENANVGKKPWQLRGEVQSAARPLNSLLESDFEHDIAVRPKVAPGIDTAASIEDIIRQRVFDGLYDDVVRKLPAEYEEMKRSKEKEGPPEVSQEKPNEGLAEMYERQYAEEREKVSKAADAASGITKREEDPQDNPEQAEVNRLYKRLCNKLDSLASLHFTPPPPKMPTEMEVKPNVPALAAEEAIPEAVSDAALLAPREVHKANDSDKQAELELDKEERRRRRRATKRHIAQENKLKIAAEKHEEIAYPALAEKRRAQRTLARPGKLLKLAKNPNSKNKSTKGKKSLIASMVGDAAGGTPRTGDFSKSTRFFTQLQETVSKDLAGKKSRGAVMDGQQTKSASKLKL